MVVRMLLPSFLIYYLISPSKIHNTVTLIYASALEEKKKR